MMKKILQLVNGELYAGAERIQEMLLRYLDRSRFEARCVALLDGVFVQRAREAGLPMEVLPMMSRLDLRVAHRLARYLRENHIDLVHTHGVRTNLIGRLAARLVDIPVITHVHSPTLEETEFPLRNRVNALVDRCLSRWSTHYICVSHSLRLRLEAEGIEPERITVVHNGIELDRFQDSCDSPMRAREEVRHELLLPLQARLITTIALFRPRKGTEFFIQALARVGSQHPEAYGVLVGDFERQGYKEQIVDLTRRLMLDGKLFFLGFRDDVSTLLAATDLFVLPSLYGEGLPLVLLEAMATATPIVATAVGGVPEVIRHGESGVLIKPGDVEGLAEAISQLLSDPQGAAQLGEQARRRVRQHDVQSMVRKIEAIYTKLLE